MADMFSILGLPFLACSFLAVTLSVLGLQVVKREIIFVDIAMAQIAAVGSVLAHLLFKVHDDSIVSFICGLVMIGLAALFFATARQRLFQVSLEAVIGVTYAVSAGAALFLVGITPGGHVHVQRLLSGNLLWVNHYDLLWMAVVFIPVVGLLWGARRPLSHLMGPDVQSIATKTLIWDVVFYVLLGLVITLGVRLAGIVVVFAYLVIPATFALLFRQRPGLSVLMAGSAGIMASGLGLGFAYRYDFSVGPSIALFLGMGLTLTALGRRLCSLSTRTTSV